LIARTIRNSVSLSRQLTTAWPTLVCAIQHTSTNFSRYK